MFQLSFYVEKYWSVLFAIALFSCYLLLGTDSIKSPDTVQRHLVLSSRDFFVGLLLTNLICRLLFKVKLPEQIEKLNTFLVIPLSLIACIVLPFVDYFTYTNFVYSRLFINYQQVSFIALGSILISLINSDLSWLKNHLRFLIFISAPILAFCLLLVRLWPNDIFMRLVKEDNLIENTQFLVLIAAGILAFLNSLKLANFSKLIAALYVVGALSLFFVAGDEISWGQRIFNTNPSGLFESNMQQETNIHNLSAVNNFNGIIYILIGLYGAFSWIFLAYISHQKFWEYFSPPWFLSSFFFLGFLYNFIAVVLMIGSFGEWSEVAELMLYMGTMLFFAQYIFLMKPLKKNRRK